ncbi:hypothetical protein CHS0354_003161 [Potamilus streckersoni]|uniref:Uncharacterized protein n=1 Tax=Potamilus streckersoni TaxID=2493646 RepID=A0AAE0W5S3_9BIVA|nr:hypothetical protein CHS0354_003161 [Potamilus streckersoni]
MTSHKLSYLQRPLENGHLFESVPARLEYIASRFPDKEAYVFLSPGKPRVSITGTELLEKSRAIAKALIGRGIKQGDIVGISQPNNVDSLLCNFGVMALGATALNIAFARPDGSDVRAILEKVKNCSALLIHPGYNNGTIKACLNFIDVFNEDGTVESKSFPSIRTLILSTNGNFDFQNYETLTKLTNERSNSSLPTLDPDDIALLIATSGSTGEQKLAAHSHRTVLMCGVHLQDSMGYTSHDVVWNERKISWIGGFPFQYLLNGVTTVTTEYRFESLKEHCLFTYSALQQEKCNIACLLPVTLNGLADIFREKKSNFILDNIHTGGAPISKACLGGLGEITKKVTVCYGNSEAGFLTSKTVSNKSEYVDYSTGFPHQGVEVKIVGKNGNIVERGQDGEIYIRTPAMYRGYFNESEKTKKSLTESGWFKTDDVGNITPEGELVAHGRVSELIICGAAKVSPSKLEHQIRNHPDVQDIVVIPIPDPIKYQVACACIIFKPNAKSGTEDVRKFCESSEPNIAVNQYSNFITPFLPEHYIEFTAFPKTYTGKTNKLELAQEAVQRLSIAM